MTTIFRTILFLSVTSIFLLSGLPSQAEITWSVSASTPSGVPLHSVSPGDVLVLDITLRSDGQEALGIGGAASGYDPSVLAFQSGSAADQFLVEVCIPALGCFNGFDNLAAGSLFEDVSNPSGPFVQFATAVTVGAGNTNTGELDPGVVTGVSGEAQFQLVFVVVGPGSTTITIGSDPTFGNALILPGGVVGVSNNASVTIAMIPEPSTALLLGLGLTGLATRSSFRRAEPARRA